jgi:plasmid stabilization system protein ParE
VKLIVSPAALTDLERLNVFLAGKNEPAAARAAEVLDDAMQSLEIFPDRGRPSNIPGARELIVPFGRSSYVLRYTHFAELDAVVILRIWHGREARE